VCPDADATCGHADQQDGERDGSQLSKPHGS
jgi:hypothetical protein